MTALTAPQRRVLDAVTALWAELGHSPSQREIAARAEVARGTVRWHLPRLAAAGQLRYAPGRYRCIVPLGESPEHGAGWVGEENCWHHGYEPIPPGIEPYIVCGECGHAFLTAADLRAAERDAWAGSGQAPRVIVTEMIYACPLCTHDF